MHLEMMVIASHHFLFQENGNGENKAVRVLEFGIWESRHTNATCLNGGLRLNLNPTRKNVSTSFATTTVTRRPPPISTAEKSHEEDFKAVSPPYSAVLKTTISLHNSHRYHQLVLCRAPRSLI
ncbi:hypothetical protein L6452_38387 [Arctium lappa]|uniref:Uncharacterized protein n=1 Tax=Arctium lappa TaxID=4217 RepID=A0ACB8Y9U6_ARCLA|nr:hypothetical protein L6452_38387 [Arctium lappa]